DDRFAGYLAALSGAGEGAAEDAALPLRARLHYAGLFAGRRSAAALQDGLSHLLRTPVTLREFRTRWRDIEPADRTRPGRTGAFTALGRDAVLGGRVCSAEDAFQVVVKAGSMAEYADLLPSGRRYAIAAEALTAFAPSHLDWEIELEIDEPKTTSTRL